MGYETPYASTIGGASDHDRPRSFVRQFSQSAARFVRCVGAFRNWLLLPEILQRNGQNEPQMAKLSTKLRGAVMVGRTSYG